MPDEMQGEKTEPGGELVVSESSLELIDSLLDQVFAAEPADMLAVAKDVIGDVDEDQLAENQPLERALESAWHYASATDGIVSAGNFAVAVEHFGQAAQGFGQLGLNDVRDLAIGMAYYSQAILETRQLNLNQARDRFREAEDYLKNAGRFSSRFEPLIDHMKVENTFVSALPALMNLDFSTARILIEEASRLALDVAKKYYEDGDVEKDMFTGYAYMYKAFYTMLSSLNDFRQFDYEMITARPDLAADARLASQFLGAACSQAEAAGTVPEILRTNSLTSAAMVRAQEAVQQLAHIMRNLLEHGALPEAEELRGISAQVRWASDQMAKAGPEAIVMMRVYDQIVDQVDNLETLLGRSQVPLRKDADSAFDFDVFLSYSHQDAEEALLVSEAIKKRNGKVFIAEKSLKPGDVFAQDIREALLSSRQLWLIVSPHSLDSHWVVSEWGAAWALGRPIVPLLHRCDASKLPDRLGSRHSIDFYKYQGLVDSTFPDTQDAGTDPA